MTVNLRTHVGGDYSSTTSSMSSQKAQQNEDLNFRVLRLLQDNPAASQRELADKVGVSHGKELLPKCLDRQGLGQVGELSKQPT